MGAAACPDGEGCSLLSPSASRVERHAGNGEPKFTHVPGLRGSDQALAWRSRGMSAWQLPTASRWVVCSAINIAPSKAVAFPQPMRTSAALLRSWSVVTPSLEAPLSSLGPRMLVKSGHSSKPLRLTLLGECPQQMSLWDCCDLNLRLSYGVTLAQPAPLGHEGEFCLSWPSYPALPRRLGFPLRG